MRVNLVKCILEKVPAEAIAEAVFIGKIIFFGKLQLQKGPSQLDYRAERFFKCNPAQPAFGEMSEAALGTRKLLCLGAGIYRFHCNDVQQRANAKLRRDTVLGRIYTDDNIMPSQKRHLRLTYFVHIAARHEQSKSLEWLLPQ